MGKEILNEYVKLIDKGYCEECNELNCIDNFPHKKIASAISDLQLENTKLKGKLKKQQEVIIKAVLELVNIDGNLSNSQLSDRICNLIDILKEVSE